MIGQAGRFGSVVTAMVTPFRDDDHAVDLDGAQQLASWLVDNGSIEPSWISTLPLLMYICKRLLTSRTISMDRSTPATCEQGLVESICSSK